jgi:hypothetical protein
MPDPSYITVALAVAVGITVTLRAIPFGMKNVIKESALLADIGRWMPLGAIVILAVYCLAAIKITRTGVRPPRDDRRRGHSGHPPVAPQPCPQHRCRHGSLSDHGQLRSPELDPMITRGVQGIHCLESRADAGRARAGRWRQDSHCRPFAARVS